jgi:hypothetical protein
VRPAVDGRPDIVIPSVDAYESDSARDGEVFVVGLKTTLKDRWRQVLNEGTRVPVKHILTVQKGVSTAQLEEMHRAGVQLVVPTAIHREYPELPAGMRLLSVAEFMAHVLERLGPGRAAAGGADLTGPRGGASPLS